MGFYVNQILDEMNRGGFIHAEDSIEHENVKLITSVFKNNISSIVNFHIGDLDDIDGFKYIKELSCLPYKHCFFSFYLSNIKENRKDLKGIDVRVREDPPTTEIISFSRNESFWWLHGCAIAKHDMFDNGLEYGDSFPFEVVGNHLFDKYILEIIFGIKCFLTAMNCKNVSTVKNNPPVNLNKKREKKGKLPLFSYYTLELNGRNEKGKLQGGTHSSPRVHLRRGHPREYRPGKWTWVQPCVVGNKKMGIIHKDYKAGRKLAEAIN